MASKSDLTNTQLSIRYDENSLYPSLIASTSEDHAGVFLKDSSNEYQTTLNSYGGLEVDYDGNKGKFNHNQMKVQRNDSYVEGLVDSSGNASFTFNDDSSNSIYTMDSTGLTLKKTTTSSPILSIVRNNFTWNIYVDSSGNLIFEKP